MNPLAITPAFTGEIEIPKAALLERDEVISTSKQIQGVNSQEELELAVNALRDLTSLEKVTESGRTKEKRPFIDFSKLIDSFAAKFIKPVTEEKARITEYVNQWQMKETIRKREEDRKRQEEQRKVNELAEEARRKIEQARATLETSKISEPEMKKAESNLLRAKLDAEEVALAQKSASIVAPANTPMGLATRVSYDFEIVDANKLIAKKPALFRWKAGEEAFHFDRSGFRVALNASIPNEYTNWRPNEDEQSIVMSDYGVRVYVSVKTNVRS